MRGAAVTCVIVVDILNYNVLIKYISTFPILHHHCKGSISEIRHFLQSWYFHKRQKIEGLCSLIPWNAFVGKHFNRRCRVSLMVTLQS